MTFQSVSIPMLAFFSALIPSFKAQASEIQRSEIAESAEQPKTTEEILAQLREGRRVVTRGKVTFARGMSDAMVLGSLLPNSDESPLIVTWLNNPGQCDGGPAALRSQMSRRLSPRDFVAGRDNTKIVLKRVHCKAAGANIERFVVVQLGRAF